MALSGRTIAKALRKSRRPSQTPGKSKDRIRCQATVDEKFVARRNRSYKYPEYPRVMERWAKIHERK